MPNRLSKLFSSSEAKEKEVLAESERDRSNDSPPPPGYEEQAPKYDRENVLEPPDITAGFSNLKISADPKDGFPQPGEAIAHLKVLECFYRLKQSIGSHDGLFGIDDKIVTGHGIPESDKTAQLLSKLAEKRWAIYLQRAVDRFETWWAAVMPDARMITRSQLELDGKNDTLLRPSRQQEQEIRFNPTNMPPADVLMVWHSYMLNPRNYLEDSIRYGRLALWHTNMPWQAASQCINSEKFAFEATPEAVQSFESLTGLPWDNLQDRNSKRVRCPLCNEMLWAAWTESPFHARGATPGQVTHENVLEGLIDEMLSSGHGYCDKDFRMGCTRCREALSHERLRSGKFVNDVKMLIQDDFPLPGTVLGHEGMPYMAFGKRDITSDPVTRIANDLFKHGLGQIIINDHAKNRDGLPKTIKDIRDAVEEAMTDRKYMRKVRGSHAHRMQRSERIAIRKIMSRYWENSSPFSLDLVGAVVRQGSFIEKMHGIDWLHSPALPSTMTRLIAKYATFLQIMASTPTRMAVPTLDVDLAWHTHQLSPYKYMEFTVKKTSQFIDHDDKVAETKLNDAFAWTSKTYQKITGHPYSECTCWYCEAIRESHTSTASRLFNGSSSRANDNLHSAPQDPKKSIHISAHNAIRPRDDAVDPIYSKESKARAEQLEKHYLKACERAKKKGKPVPKRDDYYYSDAWGYPVYIPAYSPYVGFVPYAPMYYPVTPGCMAVGAGAVGNCCSGTCGAGVAAGGCGGAGGCAGGAAGGCGGGGGGGCGGGGGGGCGGGGGGGGCGGGGGGG